VDTTEIDEAIAKLDAIGGSRPLSPQVQAIYNQEQFSTIPNSEMDALSNQTLQSMQSTVGKEVQQANIAIAAVNTQALVTVKEVDTLTEVSKFKITGLETAANRLMRRVPGLHEVERLQKNILKFDIGNIGGIVSIVMIAYSLFMKLTSALAEQERIKAEFQTAVMDAQGFTSSSQLLIGRTPKPKLFRGTGAKLYHDNYKRNN
jgi:hypothetical protein